MKLFMKEQLLVLWCFSASLLLSSCGCAGPECGSLDTRNSVVKIISDDNNNALVNYAANNSNRNARNLGKCLFEQCQALGRQFRGKRGHAGDEAVLFADAVHPTPSKRCAALGLSRDCAWTMASHLFLPKIFTRSLARHRRRLSLTSVQERGPSRP